MKVSMMKDYRHFFTLEEVDQAKEVIRTEKEDTSTPASWAEYAVREALKGENDHLNEVILASASTAKNSRVWEAYGVDTGRMDVWIEATAKTQRGFIEIGAYLSDIWQSGAVEYKEHMYIQKYIRE